LASRPWVIGIAAALILCGSASIGLSLFFNTARSEREIRRLIETSYNRQRPGGGRLSGTLYTSTGREFAGNADLGRAQILLLGRADSEPLQALVHLAAGEWQKFVDLVNNSSLQTLSNSATLNNLGASYLALSESDPIFLLKAVDEFEHASKLDPKAPEALFNLVIAYRKLHFPRIASDYFKRYSAVDSHSDWHNELENPSKKDEAALLSQLEDAISHDNRVEAEQLFRANAELCRRVAMQHALSNEDESPALLSFIASQMEGNYGDKTVSAMLAPLDTDERETVIAIRTLVNRGAESYVRGNFSESLSAYAEAAKLVRKTDSLFDRLWIDLNRVDTAIRLGHFDEARETLSRITRAASEHQLLWLQAKALSIYGSTLRLTSSYTEMLELLSTADRAFIQIEAPHDRIRVLYSLAYYQYVAGDENEALKLALECLGLVNDGDTVRISTLDWLIGSILYRRGMVEKSLLFAKASVEQSQSGPYANALEFTASTTLAELYHAISEDELADEYLKIAEEAFQKVPPGLDHIRNELRLGIVKAKVKINQQKYDQAEALLQRNLQLYEKQPFSATPLLSQSLMLLASLYSETRRIGEAGRKFTEAIEVVERDDEYLKLEGLRVKFDDARRDLYDSAIDFEFRNGSLDAAWTYLQKYRAKLFLEFLAAFNPRMAHDRVRPDRAGTQQRIPKDTQIVEYALLKDHLLIWVVTDKLFVVRSVPTKRTDLEAKVQTVLEKLRTGQDVDALLTDLGHTLIEPISNLLDPNRTITIIPDRALHGLPFGALKVPGKPQYLIQNFPIVVSPTLAHFLTSNGTQPSRDAIVGFGSQNGGSTEFRELAALTEIYPQSSTFTGNQVDKRSFLEGLKTAGVFHYAGHSATDAIDPLRSSILLDGNRSGPNSVTAVDISQQRLMNNAVVILSSCDSAVGNSRDGIGVRGLTSAFLIGGAGSVVGSLWPVEASSTAELMIRFHRAFASSKMPVATALREAQLAFLNTFPDRSHPYYWSGFVVTGDASTLR
jgi:CHAT domain-containing protein/tetratricopeptide (TPR) repeat protein